MILTDVLLAELLAYVLNLSYFAFQFSDTTLTPLLRCVKPEVVLKSNHLEFTTNLWLFHIHCRKKYLFLFLLLEV
jgi:hypothetical protein